jgi:hypothetical protein
MIGYAYVIQGSFLEYSEERNICERSDIVVRTIRAQMERQRRRPAHIVQHLPAPSKLQADSQSKRRLHKQAEAEQKHTAECAHIEQPCEVVNVRKSELRKAGYEDFVGWLRHPNHVYIGRANHYVEGVVASKWGNIFTAKHGTTEQRLASYEEYVRSKPELMGSLDELEGRVLGCWCAPNPCHGFVLQKLLRERLADTHKESTAKEELQVP